MVSVEIFSRQIDQLGILEGIDSPVECDALLVTSAFEFAHYW